MMNPSFTPIADHALLVTFAEDISEEAHAAVLSLDEIIAADPPKGVIETVPALVNLLVDFDPLATDHGLVQRALEQKISDLKPVAVVGADRKVQVCYEPPYAPDLATLAKAVGLSEDAVINAHLAGEYRVLMYGFSPGYAYLSGVTAEIQVPRKPTAVRDVPAGSVIVAGPQCLVTTLTMPTGWTIIGRSPTRILTGDQSRPFLFDVGDRVVFERISKEAFERIETQATHG